MVLPTIEQPAATSPKTSLNTDSDTKQIISTPTTNISTDTQSIDKATETSIEQRVAVTPNPSENTQPAINSNIKPTTSAPTTNTSTNKATEAPPTAKTITSQQATITPIRYLAVKKKTIPSSFFVDAFAFSFLVLCKHNSRLSFFSDWL